MLCFVKINRVIVQVWAADVEFVITVFDFHFFKDLKGSFYIKSGVFDRFYFRSVCDADAYTDRNLKFQILNIA
jgi:hypothetical protein